MTAPPGRLPRWAPSVLLAVLAVLYLKELGGPSLWLDEAWEANYYVGFEPAPWYNRPLLYMAGVKGLARLFGPSEFALRLLPCAAGILAVTVTYRLARQALTRGGALLACAILAAADPFLTASHQVKNYAPDALFTVGLVRCYARWRERPDMERWAVFAAAGLLSVGFSFPGIFVVVALAAVELASNRSEPRRSLPIVAASAVVGSAFLAVFLLAHRTAATEPGLVTYFEESYAPLAHPSALVTFLARETARVLRDQSGISSAIAAAALVAAGVFRVLGGPARLVGAALGATLGVNALVSGFHLYPYGVTRLSVYLAPLIAILVAHGLFRLGADGRFRIARAVVVSALGVAVFVPGLTLAATHLGSGWRRENIRDLVARVLKSAAPGEAIVVAEDAVPAFAFYWRRGGRAYPPEGLVVAARFRQDPSRHLAEVAALAARYESAWTLLTHMPEDEKQVFLDGMGERFDSDRSRVVDDARLDHWTRR
jgi:4-amino-4-deoxy-L-arabinose transferase-like glycosyltransferase